MTFSVSRNAPLSWKFKSESQRNLDLSSESSLAAPFTNMDVAYYQ